MCSEGGFHSLGYADCGEESWCVRTFIGLEPGFWDVECGEWTTKRDRAPYGLIVSARGWISIEIK